jgi:hypothetical protein
MSVNNNTDIPPPTSFLCLAPSTSASYPKSSSASVSASSAIPPTTLESQTPAETGESAVESPVEEKLPEVGAEASELGKGMEHRRTSSMTSNGSAAAKRRFLKLGPIFGNENHSDCWSEALEE